MEFLDSHAVHLVAAARGLFFLLFALFFLRAARWVGRETPRRPGPASRPARVLLAGFWISFVAVFAHQASWQLAGFLRPQFVTFMRRYGRRPVNPARQQVRGRILDRNGIELAADSAVEPGQRVYPQQGAFVHLVGFSHPVYGSSGIERADEQALAGTGLEAVRDLGEFGRNVLDHAGIRGADRALTLDARLQSRAVEVLADRPGAVVALCPADGAILVLASSPSFDPNDADRLRAGPTPGAPMFNRALNGLYPPGSTFKIVTATLAAEKGFDQPLYCPADGFVPAPGARTIRDHEYYAYQRRGEQWTGHGSLQMRDAFAHSSNVFFAQLGIRLGADSMAEIADRFLLERRFTVFSGSSGTIGGIAGQVPPLSDRDPTAVAQVAIGQGSLTVSPLHMAVLTAAIAQDGLAYQPHCRLDEPRRVLARLASPAVARKVQNLMRHAVTDGTARPIRMPELAVAGKTGTAQTGTGPDHSWFVCFAPFERPAIAMAVIVEGGGYGARTALPIAAALLRQAQELGIIDELARRTPGRRPSRGA